MSESEIRNPKSQIFLGVDGGQSHTEAVIADERGNVLGRGAGGASNHAEQPGGRERLRNAVIESVGEALRNIEPQRRGDAEKKTNKDYQGETEIAASPHLRVSASRFESAHFGMTGGADYKEEIIGEIINAEILKIGHDAPTALCGATAGEPGIVVIAGTGSIVYGENSAGETAQIGGLGFLFSDEGSGFWLAAQTIRLAIKEQDGLIPKTGLERLVLEFFNVKKIRDLTTAFYNERISRDEIAALARRAHEAAENGNETLKNQIRGGAQILAESVGAAALKLKFDEKFPVAGVGGMFRAALVKKFFREALTEKIPRAEFVAPRFGPAIGALLLAYRQANVEITAQLLSNLENFSER
jgi:N-acetylglucosamine kinase-like BadF-type ATPase